MPTKSSFDYAVVRVVPRVEREEFINAGVVLFCLEQRFLGTRVLVDEARLHALWPHLDVAMVRRHLEGISKVCAGDPAAGPIARLSVRERFHWIVSPKSTMIQVSPVHSGISESPQDSLEQLARLFLSPPYEAVESVAQSSGVAT